jgi:hypothetical protein
LKGQMARKLTQEVEGTKSCGGDRGPQKGQMARKLADGGRGDIVPYRKPRAVEGTEGRTEDRGP